MRYQVGALIPFIGISYVDQSDRNVDLGFRPLYLPWEHKLLSMEVSLMLCSEHHRVPGEWSDNLEYDGFIFLSTGEKQERWFNQYPRAAYGQLSSRDDNLSKDLPFDAEPPPEEHTSMLDARSYLLSLYRGARDVDEENPVRGAMLHEHYNAVVEALQKLGVRVIVEPSSLSLKNYVRMRLEVTQPVESLERKWRAVAEKRLAELVDLKEGWDGYSGKPTTAANAALCMTILSAVMDDTMPQPSLVPTAEGSIQIEWHTTRGDVEVRLEGADGVKAEFTTTGSEYRFGSHMVNDFANLTTWLNGIKEDSDAVAELVTAQA